MRGTVACGYAGAPFGAIRPVMCRSALGLIAARCARICSARGRPTCTSRPIRRMLGTAPLATSSASLSAAATAWPLRAAPANRRKLDVVEDLARLAEQSDMTLITMAIAFVLNHPGVTSAIVGPRTMEQLESYLPLPFAEPGGTAGREVVEEFRSAGRRLPLPRDECTPQLCPPVREEASVMVATHASLMRRTAMPGHPALRTGAGLGVLAVLLDQAAPSLAPAELIGDGPAAGQLAVLAAIGHRPCKSLLLQTAARCPLAGAAGRFCHSSPDRWHRCRCVRP
jgi:hypothetical protein